jgi:hypothetical protein
MAMWIDLVLMDSFLFLLTVAALVLGMLVIGFADVLGLWLADRLIGWQNRKELNHDRFK